MTLRDLVQARRELPPPPLRRAIRQAAGASLEDVGREVGVSRQAVQKWEQGSASPGRDHVEAYARVLRELMELA